MKSWTPLSAAEQVALYLRKELVRGNWGGRLPGVRQLSKELGVNHKTVRSAVKLLEEEGVLVNQGPGRERRVIIPEGEVSPMRISILPYDKPSHRLGYMVDLQHQLAEAGHSVSIASKTLLGLDMNVKRIRRMVGSIETDAWVVVGASRHVLSWFSEQEIPAFALFGGRLGLPLAGTGPDHAPALRASIKRLMALGHQRIVMLRRGRTKEIGVAERAFLDELELNGISTSPYHIPDWENTAEGFVSVLEGLFRVTPPTALILDGPLLFHAAKDYLARRGILAPDHVSLISIDPDPTFEWSDPTVAHSYWDPAPVVRGVLRWATNVGRGKKDVHQGFTKAEFVDGGTVGNAPK